MTIIREQLSLWEDPAQIILNKEKVDISTLRDSKDRVNSFKNLPKETYYIYKTGGINPFKKELGKIFPFLKNDVNGRVFSIVDNDKSNPYPHWHISLHNKLYKLVIHKTVALAFLDLPEDQINIKTQVDHLDGDHKNYLPPNLEWVSPSENNRRRKSFTWRRKWGDS